MFHWEGNQTTYRVSSELSLKWFRYPVQGGPIVTTDNILWPVRRCQRTKIPPRELIIGIYNANREDLIIVSHRVSREDFIIVSHKANREISIIVSHRANRKTFIIINILIFGIPSAPRNGTK